jgi:ABC-2 type transport system ATP-binding protein
VPAILASQLTKRYGTLDALKGIDLAVEPGEFFGLFGPNGAGKTTMLRILTGQLRPTAGEARVLDIDVVEAPLQVKSLVGIVPEVESPPSYLTAHEYLYFVGRVRKLDRIEERIAHWFEFFDLDEGGTTLCKDLSKGTRQKLMLAAAFIHEPALVFLDEPFINLDPIYQRKLKEFLAEYVAGGGTAFMASHLLDIAAKLCHRVAIIRSGSIIATGTVDQIRAHDSDLESAFLRLVGA